MCFRGHQKEFYRFKGSFREYVLKRGASCYFRGTSGEFQVGFKGA